MEMLGGKGAHWTNSMRKRERKSLGGAPISQKRGARPGVRPEERQLLKRKTM